MSYKINFTDSLANPSGITVQDQSINSSDTSLVFIGKNFPNYSQYIGENFLHLLENFAKNSSPSNPIKGQLWYDTGTLSIPAKPQLKVYDGTNWVEAGSVKKNTVRPATENSLVGDLWVDSTNQQLYLFTGSSWVLVGPQFNESASTGFKSETIIDRATNTGKIVISFYIEDTRILIISKYEFSPKLAIPGFTTIKQGLNLSNLDFDLDGIVLNKFWGTSEKSNALIVSNAVVPAANFLRNDIVSTTNFALNIRNGSGINIGPSLETSITSSNTATVIHQTNPGGQIVFRTTPAVGTFSNILTITADNKVGLNKQNPTEALDVVGNLLLTGTIKSTNNTSSTNTTSGSLVVAGGAGIGQDLNVGGKVNIDQGLIVGGTIEPTANLSFNLGSSTKKYSNIYAQNVEASTFIGNVQGELFGNVSGTAARLANTSAFLIEGEITSNTIPFNGSSFVNDTTIQSVGRSSNVASITTTAPHNYVTGFIVSITCNITSFNTISSSIIVTGPSTFTFSNPGITISTTATTGTIKLIPGGSFSTVINSVAITNKPVLNISYPNDTFLVYRTTGTTSPFLGKMEKSALFAGVSTVPVGAIFPYAGETPPAGYLLCDGSEQSRSTYPELFSAIGFKYKAELQLLGFNTFGLPDFRGRFAAGKNNMDNNSIVNKQTVATGVTRNLVNANGTSATFEVLTSSIVNGPFQVGKYLENTGLIYSALITNVQVVGLVTTISVTWENAHPELLPASGLTITSIGTLDSGGGLITSGPKLSNATNLGNVGGSENVSLAVTQLPEHTHDLKSDNNNQYYAFRNVSGPVTDTNVISGSGPTGINSGQYLNNSGGINSTGPFGQPIDITNPFITVNYIIWPGQAA